MTSIRKEKSQQQQKKKMVHTLLSEDIIDNHSNLIKNRKNYIQIKHDPTGNQRIYK